jgi:hypothetical protein
VNAPSNIGFDDSGAPVPCYTPDMAAAIDGPPEAAQSEDDAARLANLLQWLATPTAEKYFGHAHKLRVTALAWAMNPSAFGGASLSQLAVSLGVGKAALSKYAAQAARVFGIRNRAQIAHGSRWKKRRQRGR